jgi:adenylate cyclase
METLHPQWSGYGYTWRRDLNAIAPEQYPRSVNEEPTWVTSPFYALIQRARAGEDTPAMRRRIEVGPEERDFPVLDEFFTLGATDYVAQLYTYGEKGDRSQGTGIVYSFISDRKGGFGDNDTTLIQATLPALSLAMKARHCLRLAWSLSRGRRRTARACRRGGPRFGRQTARGALVC